MNERAKLSEAEYFFIKMYENSEDNIIFIHYLSAFISSARSILQYSLEEAKVNKGQPWYDNWIANCSLFKYFKNKRDINIHREPLSPVLHKIVTYRFTIKALSEKLEKPWQPPTTKLQYYFDDWCDEGIFELCQEYLNKLKTFIDDGMKKGFISG
jgi:hypothetical protein